jgi:hypothetical protein
MILDDYNPQLYLYFFRYNPQAFTTKPKGLSMTSLTERRKAILFLILAALLWSTAGFCRGGQGSQMTICYNCANNSLKDFLHG